MPTPVRIGLALSSAAFAFAIAGCAAQHANSEIATSFGGKADGDIGVATRALAALNANDIPAATGFAERAVARTPDDAGFRALLGNAYFAGGRFASAESAFKDSLSIYSNQPQIVLKLALVEIAQGKRSEAAAFLDAARTVLDPADYGLALALAGHAPEAAVALRDAARSPTADARVRQNLALAYALAGDWTNARLVAAQDLTAEQVDARVKQWMQMASPRAASDQVVALTGVKPAASDPGQPVRLAWRKAGTGVAVALAQPVPQAPPQVQPQPATAPAALPVFAAPAPLYGVAQATPPAPPPADPARVAGDHPAAAAAAVATVATPEPVIAIAQFVPPPPAPLLAAVKFVAPHLPATQPVFTRAATQPVFTRAATQQRKVANLRRASALMRQAALRRGGSSAVVQLGAFSSAQSVSAAWNAAARRYGALRAYAPMSARFNTGRAMVYRLSVRGFASGSEAISLCSSLRRSGGSCFVRTVAGDAPVQIALR